MWQHMYSLPLSHLPLNVKKKHRQKKLLAVNWEIFSTWCRVDEWIFTTVLAMKTKGSKGRTAKKIQPSHDFLVWEKEETTLRDLQRIIQLLFHSTRIDRVTTSSAKIGSLI